MTGRAVLYARVSDIEQADGTGIARQLKVCREAIAHDNFQLVREFVEPASRPDQQPGRSFRQCLHSWLLTVSTASMSSALIALPEMPEITSPSERR